MIIDSHAHLGYLSGMYNYKIGAEALVNAMDLLGISKTMNSNCYSLTFGDLESGYPQDIAAFDMSGGRILSYYVYDPNNAEQCLRYMDIYSDRNIFRGIKIHPSWHGVYADDEAYRPVFEYASAKELPIMSHTWTISLTNPVQKFSTPDRFEKYLRDYSDVTLILGHAGGRYGGICQAIGLAQKYSKLYVDIAGDIYIARLVETLSKALGPDRVLYGSDYPMMDQRIMLGAVLGADIGVEDKKKILSGNAMRIFGIQV